MKKTKTVTYIQFRYLTTTLYGELVKRNQWYLVHDMDERCEFDEDEGNEDCIEFETEDGSTEYMRKEDLDYSTIEIEVNVDQDYNPLWNVA